MSIRKLHKQRDNSTLLKLHYNRSKNFAEIRTVTQIDQAEAGLKSLEANLEKIKTGARDEDRQKAQAGLNQAKANLLNAQNNYARMEQLFKNGAISQQSLENSQTQLDIVTAQHKIASEQLQLIDNGAREEDIQAMEAQVEQAKAALRLAQAQAATKTWEKDIALVQSQVENSTSRINICRSIRKSKKLGSRDYDCKDCTYTSEYCP